MPLKRTFSPLWQTNNTVADFVPTMMSFFFNILKKLFRLVCSKNIKQHKSGILKLNLRSLAFCWYTAEELCQQIYILYFHWTTDFGVMDIPSVWLNEQTSGYIVQQLRRENYFRQRTCKKGSYLSLILKSYNLHLLFAINWRIRLKSDMHLLISWHG